MSAHMEKGVHIVNQASGGAPQARGGVEFRMRYELALINTVYSY